jgi:hypothetical protein
MILFRKESVVPLLALLVMLLAQIVGSHCRRLGAWFVRIVKRTAGVRASELSCHIARQEFFQFRCRLVTGFPQPHSRFLGEEPDWEDLLATARRVDAQYRIHCGYLEEDLSCEDLVLIVMADHKVV